MITNFGSIDGSLVIPMLGVLDPWLAPVQILEDQSVLAVKLCELRLDVADDEGVDVRWCLGWHEAANLGISAAGAESNTDKPWLTEC